MRRLLLISLGLSVIFHPNSVAKQPPRIFPSLDNRIQIIKKSHFQDPKAVDPKTLDEARKQILKEKRVQLQKGLLVFLKKTKRGPAQASIMIRLARLYMEDYFVGLDDQAISTDPAAAKQTTMRALEKARMLYQTLLRRYPTHPQRPEILFSFALASFDSGFEEEGLAHFKMILEEFPRSSLAGEALIQLGDHAFNGNQWKVAMDYYARVIRQPFKPLVQYALYKNAWCDFNTGHLKEALAKFKTVIDTHADKRIGVKNEALNDIILVFSELRLVDESIDFFMRVGDPYRRGAFESMAALYNDMGEHGSAIRFWQTLLELEPYHVKAPKYSMGIIHTMGLTNKKESAVELLLSVSSQYLAGSKWAAIHAKDSKTIQEVEQLFEEALRKDGLYYHALGQKMNNKKDYELAYRLYTKYLHFFPESPEASEIRFHCAEILAFQQKYEKAAELYYAVYQDPRAEKLRREAITRTLSTLMLAVETERAQKGLKKVAGVGRSSTRSQKQSVEPTAFSNLEKRFIQIAQEYIKAFPKDPFIPEAYYNMASLYYLHQDYDRAQENYKLMLAMPLNDQMFYEVAHLSLDIYNQQKKYDPLIELAKALLKDFPKTTQTFRAEVAKILRQSEFKRIEVLDQEKRYAEAADSYLKYIELYGAQDADLYEKALLNAAVNMGYSGQISKSVELLEKFNQKFPNSTFKDRVWLDLAKGYEALARLDRSAYYFEKFVAHFPEDSRAENASRLAGLYYWGARKFKKAENIFYQTLENYPKSRSVIVKDLLNFYRSQNSPTKELNLVRHLLSENVLSPTEAARAFMAIGRRHETKTPGIFRTAVNETTKLVTSKASLFNKTPGSKELAAEIQLLSLKPMEDQFQRISPSHQANSLKKKIELMKELEKKYKTIGASGGPQGYLAAVYSRGRLLANFAKFVEMTPMPPGLKADQLEIYRKELKDNWIQPFTVRASEILKDCIEKSKTEGFISRWTALCYQLAVQINPTDTRSLRTFYVPPLQVVVRIPDDKSKIRVGNTLSNPYPFESSHLYRQLTERNVERSTSIPDLSNMALRFQDVIPQPVNYSTLSLFREREIEDGLASREPSAENGSAQNWNETITFAYLNLLRMKHPEKALPLVLKAISQDPKNRALHNLLGLCYLDTGDLISARVTWLSMTAIGDKNADVLNNLGVVSYLEADETQAIDYFMLASQIGGVAEPFSNLGSIALKYRNGAEAKIRFEQALQQRQSNLIAQIGKWVAETQLNPANNHQDTLVQLAKSYEKDPFALLSAVYFLMDVNKDFGTAKTLLLDTATQEVIEREVSLSNALFEAQERMGSPI